MNEDVPVDQAIFEVLLPDGTWMQWRPPIIRLSGSDWDTAILYKFKPETRVRIERIDKEV